MNEFYTQLTRQLQALTQDSPVLLSNLSNAAALLYQSIPDINWAGFYLARDRELLLGPFGGKPACLRIPFEKGVCGQAARSLETVVVPMESRRDAALAIYKNIYEKAAQAYREGKRVAVAVEGDAGIYASMHYVLDRCCDADLPVGQQPGIPSFIAAAGMAQLHLASRQERLTIIPGNITRTEIETYLVEGHTLVVMKLSRCEETIKQCLTAHPEYDWHYFENVGTTNAVHLTHPSDILLRSFPYFSLLVLRHAPHRASI